MLTINNMITNQDAQKQNISQVVSELNSMANILNLETQKRVLAATGAIDENEFTSETFNGLLTRRLEKQMETFERPRVCMFICPKLDVTDMQNATNLYPSKLSISSLNGQKADIFVSRIPRIFQLFENMAKNNMPLELILLIGDSDFAPEVGYNWLAIKAALDNGAKMEEFDEQIFASKVSSYKNFLISLLNLNRVQGNVELFQSVGDEESSFPRIIRVLSLYELYKCKAVPISTDTNFNMDFIKERSKIEYGYFQGQANPNNPTFTPEYDPNFFSKITREQVEQITLDKFKSYRDQGLLVQQMGGILIADELPPIIKAEIYGDKLLMVWPWIRKEAQERNLDYNPQKPPKIKLIEPPVEG